jgi:hypothetical protein
MDTVAVSENHGIKTAIVKPSADHAPQAVTEPHRKKRFP